jgi:hypothetical protein
MPAPTIEPEAAVVINTARPSSLDERKVEMSLKVSENLLRRRLEGDIKTVEVELATAKETSRTSREAMMLYAEEYGKEELLKSKILEELMTYVNRLLALKGTTPFTMSDFLDDVGVGDNHYNSSILDEDGLLIVRPDIGIRVDFPFRHNSHDTDEQILSYHVTIDSKLDDLMKQKETDAEASVAIGTKLNELKLKLKNIKRTVSDVETDLLIKQLKEMEGGEETFKGVAAILTGYVNGEQAPNLLEAAKPPA